MTLHNLGIKLSASWYYRFNIETIPGYEYMDIRTPVADYVVNAGTWVQVLIQLLT